MGSQSVMHLFWRPRGSWVRAKRDIFNVRSGIRVFIVKQLEHAVRHNDSTIGLMHIVVALNSCERDESLGSEFHANRWRLFEFLYREMSWTEEDCGVSERAPQTHGGYAVTTV
jgi:hypothetical protein